MKNTMKALRSLGLALVKEEGHPKCVKYYAFMDQAVRGPLEAETLTTLPNFGRRTLVQGEERFDSDHSRWTEAGEVPLLALLMDARDRDGSRTRAAAALDGFSAARRSTERDLSALTRSVAESVGAQRAALEDARREMAVVVGRLDGIESALKGIRTAVYLAVVVAGAVGLAALALPRSGSLSKPAPEAAPPPAPLMTPKPPAVNAEPAKPAPRPPVQAAQKPAPRPAPTSVAPSAAPARKPVPAKKPARAAPSAGYPKDELEAVTLVGRYLIRSPAPTRCPRSLEEALNGDGGPARTPQEAADCRAWLRVMALRDALAAGRRWSSRKALKEVEHTLSDMGGFEAAFPPYASARWLNGRTYEVELSRTDLLTRRLSMLFNVYLPADAPARQRYEADLDAGVVRPRP